MSSLGRPPRRLRNEGLMISSAHCAALAVLEEFFGSGWTSSQYPWSKIPSFLDCMVEGVDIVGEPVCSTNFMNLDVEIKT